MNKLLITVMAILALTLLAGDGYALLVGWNVDIHQNKFLDGANDFHMTGVLEDGGDGPSLLSHIDGPFTTFDYDIEEGSQGPPFYDFTADWNDVDTNMYPSGYIPYCSWIHLGLEFDEECHNIGYWLRGTWTRDGIDPENSPMYGFKVDDLAPMQYIRIQNASYVPTELIQMDLAILPAGTEFPLSQLNAEYFAAHPEFPWFAVSIPTPVYMNGIDSFFDVYVEQVMGRPLGPSELLLSRQYSSYEGGSTDYFWNFEIHEAHVPEPATIVMIASGLMGLVAVARRKFH